MKKDNDDFINSITYKEFIHECGEQFYEFNEMAQQHELFLYDRKTLSCVRCGLTEDIAFNGKLFTFQKGDLEFKETGLQFIGLDDKNERFRCPVCSTEILALLEK